MEKPGSLWAPWLTPTFRPTIDENNTITNRLLFIFAIFIIVASP